MSYTTVAFVREIIGKYGVTEEAFSNDRIQDAIDSADGLINGYVAAQYAIPLAVQGIEITGDKLINSLSSNLAAYDIVLTFQGSHAIEQGDPVALRHSDALRTLQSVSTGKISWPQFDTAATEDSGASIVGFNEYEGNLFGPQDFSIRPAGFDRGGYFGGRGPGPSGTW